MKTFNQLLFLVSLMVTMAACFFFGMTLWMQGHLMETVVVALLMLYCFFYVAGFIDAMLKDAKQQKVWIPVTERMPPGGLPVRVLANNRGAEGVAWWGGHEGDTDPFWRLCVPGREEITHWREMDEHPERAEEDKV